MANISDLTARVIFAVSSGLNLAATIVFADLFRATNKLDGKP